MYALCLLRSSFSTLHLQSEEYHFCSKRISKRTNNLDLPSCSSCVLCFRVTSAIQASLRLQRLACSSLEISSLITSPRYSTLHISVWVLQYPQEVCKKEQVQCEIRAWFQEQLTEPSQRTHFSMERNVLIL